PFIMIASQPEFGNIIEIFILEDIFRVQVTVIINNWQRFRDVTIKFNTSRIANHKVIVNKTHERAPYFRCFAAVSLWRRGSAASSTRLKSRSRTSGISKAETSPISEYATSIATIGHQDPVILQKIPASTGPKPTATRPPASLEIAMRVKRFREPNISAMVMFSSANSPSTAKL